MSRNLLHQEKRPIFQQKNPVTSFSQLGRTNPINSFRNVCRLSSGIDAAIVSIIARRAAWAAFGFVSRSFFNVAASSSCSF
jgi:hypothetical protein